MSTIREDLAAYAETLVGLTAPDPRYLTLVAPWEMANGQVPRAKSIANASDCALVAHGIMDGVLDLPPRARYVIEHAITDLVALARVAGAYVERPRDPPQIGDILHLAPVPGHDEHVGTIVDAGSEKDTDTLLFYWRVDGGRRNDAGRETILRLSRPLKRYGPGWAEQDTGRVVAGLIDADKMAAHFGRREIPPTCPR